MCFNVSANKYEANFYQLTLINIKLAIFQDLSYFLRQISIICFRFVILAM